MQPILPLVGDSTTRTVLSKGALPTGSGLATAQPDTPQRGPQFADLMGLPMEQEQLLATDASPPETEVTTTKPDAPDAPSFEKADVGKDRSEGKTPGDTGQAIAPTEMAKATVDSRKAPALKVALPSNDSAKPQVAAQQRLSEEPPRPQLAFASPAAEVKGLSDALAPAQPDGMQAQNYRDRPVDRTIPTAAPSPQVSLIGNATTKVDPSGPSVSLAPLASQDIRPTTPTPQTNDQSRLSLSDQKPAAPQLIPENAGPPAGHSTAAQITPDSTWTSPPEAMIPRPTRAAASLDQAEPAAPPQRQARAQIRSTTDFHGAADIERTVRHATPIAHPVQTSAGNPQERAVNPTLITPPNTPSKPSHDGQKWQLTTPNAVGQAPKQAPAAAPPSTFQHEASSATVAASTLMTHATTRPIATPDDVTVIQQVIKLKGTSPDVRQLQPLPESAASLPSQRQLPTLQTPAMTPPQPVVTRHPAPPDHQVPLAIAPQRTPLSPTRPAAVFADVAPPLTKAEPSVPPQQGTTQVPTATQPETRPTPKVSFAPAQAPLSAELNRAGEQNAATGQRMTRDQTPSKTADQGTPVTVTVPVNAPIPAQPAMVRPVTQAVQKAAQWGVGQTLVEPSKDRISDPGDAPRAGYRNDTTAYVSPPPRALHTPMQAHVDPVMTAQPMNDDAAKTVAPMEFDPLTGVRIEPGSSAVQITQTQPTRMDLPTHVARQIADVAQHMPNRPVEITLSPEELGRVRLSMNATEAGLVVNVLAERSETLDLMRRHIQHLDQEFQALGYDDVSFSFDGGNGAQQPDLDQDNTDPDFGMDTGPIGLHSPMPATPIAANSGLDLRL